MHARRNLFFILIVLLIASLACAVLGGGDKAAAPPTEETAPEEAAPEAEEPASEQADEVDEPPAAEEEEEAVAEEYDTVFPLPDDVQNFTGAGGESQVNFATSLSIEESIEFYRQAFAEQGLTERQITTAITDDTFSIVFDGHTSGQAIVVQGVDLGNGTTNINIRFEDV